LKEFVVVLKIGVKLSCLFNGLKVKLKGMFQMRRSMLILVLCVFFTLLIGSSASAKTVIKAGIDFPTDISIEFKSYDTSGGFSLAAEYLFGKNTTDEFGLIYGVGAEYQTKRSWLKDDLKFSFIPFYGLVNYNVGQGFYITGKIGFNVYNIDENNDEIFGGSSTYYCIGAGKVIKNKYQVEMKYAVNNGMYHKMGYTHTDIIYSKLGVSVGVIF
jgi:hypothetical protein